MNRHKDMLAPIELKLLIDFKGGGVFYDIELVEQ
jgi:hypothetical protein